MDRAQVPFGAQGLSVPSYVAFGNHDGLVQGNAFATRGYEDVATGCVKPTAPASNPFDPQSALDPGYLSGLLGSDPGKVGLVPRDPDRRYVDHRQFKELFKSGQGDGHGFGFVDGAENAATAGHAGYYAWSPRRGFRFIALDTVSEGGVPGPSAEGNIDDPQFRWLERQLGGRGEGRPAHDRVRPPPDPQPELAGHRRAGRPVRGRRRARPRHQPGM